MGLRLERSQRTSIIERALQSNETIRACVKDGEIASLSARNGDFVLIGTAHP